MNISYSTCNPRKLAQSQRDTAPAYKLESARQPGNEKLNHKCYLKMFRNAIEAYDLDDDLNRPQFRDPGPKF